MTNRLHVRIRGRVQGVGFRWATRRAAEDYGLTGWVKNCTDGTVEAEFDGAPEALQSMREWCHRGPTGASVTAVDELPGTDASAYAAFEIVA